MRFIELFAGIGGFRYGLENTKYALIGEESKQEERTQRGKRSVDERSVQLRNRDKPSFRCVYANEWDKYAAQIYERHYEKPDTRDIRNVDAKDIPKHELLTAGFPCQSFSIAGKRGGFEDTRGTLFFEIARIAKQKQSRLLLLENVKGLLSHDKGKTFATILNTLDELGYDLQWQVLNSKDFGVPQNRERVFIIGHLRGTSRPEVFPIGQGNEKHTGEDAQGNNIAHTLTNTDKYRGSYNGVRIRKLIPTECERLQGFPDNWTDGISDTQRYKCLGNAVTTNVVTAIGERILHNG